MPDLEIAVTSASGAVVARSAGADRVELCSALELGGVTPSAGLVDAVLAEVGGPGWGGVHVLVRPRPGDFVYDAADAETALREVRALAAAGVDGVVIGALTDSGEVDLDLTRRLVDAARSETPQIAVTFHRALDQADHLEAALESLLGLVDRVLTSGGAAAAGDGVQTLARLVRLADRRIQVMAGGGVQLDSIPALVAAGVDAVHLSAKQRVLNTARVALGAGDDAGAHWTTDPVVVAAAARALRA